MSDRSEPLEMPAPSVAPNGPLLSDGMVAGESAQHPELQALRLKCAQLQSALDGERDINVAVGITMIQHRLARTEAANLLRQIARHRRCKLTVLAAEIIVAAQALVLRP